MTRLEWIKTNIIEGRNARKKNVREIKRQWDKS